MIKILVLAQISLQHTMWLFWSECAQINEYDNDYKFTVYSDKL